MDEVKLQFQTPQDFTAFRKIAGDSVISFSITSLTIVCHCTMVNIARAMNQFGAKVID